ncbi:MAG: ABC transporter substrate-binding protein [Acetobacteraceae bacterium]|nr:ABC transporter substrate-binding protein [Acetobacteraceae bacterium]
MGLSIDWRAVLRNTLLATAAFGLLAGSAVAQKRGGTLTVGMELDITGFDPLKVGVFDTSAYMAAALIFDTLTMLDDKGAAQPKLAVSWTSSEDLKTWTFKLRAGVKFQDGTPFNAAAVKWNIDRQKDPANKCRCAFYISNVDAVDAPDELTLIFRLNTPSSMLPETLSLPSSNNVMQSPTAIQAKGDDYNRNPVGTGPYVLKSWVAGDRMALEKNPDYWDKDRVYLDRIALKPLPDAQARFASLQSGSVDIIWHDESDSDNLKKVATMPAFTLHTYVGSGAGVSAINTKNPPLDDVNVRRALVMALDRKGIADAIYGGMPRPATNPYGEGSWVKCADDGALPYDVAKAKALIQAYGKPVKFALVVTSTPRGRAVGQVYQQMWKTIGADVSIEQIDQASFPPRAFARKFDVIGWRIIDLADPDPQMYANFHSASPVNLANYSNPELDRLLQHARVTADRTERTKDYCAISRLLNSEATWFWTFQNTYYAISKARVKGLPKMYSGVIDVSHAWLD